MKESVSFVDRQNDETALKLLKASDKCFKMERVVKYIMVCLSFLICVAAIINRYLVDIVKLASQDKIDQITQFQETAATYINLISGALICVGIVTGFYVTRMHNEGCALQDRYEAYVFNNAPNKSILRPVAQSYIDRYARVSAKKEAQYLYHIFPKDKKILNESTAQYEFIKKEVRHDYDMYLFIQPFFLTLWIGFCIFVIIMAISFNDDFVTTLINVLIPSLSAITTISSSWYNNRIQMKQLNNLLNCIERIENLSQEGKKNYITNPEKVRQLADGLFNYRVSPFVIPIFLQNWHNKQFHKKTNLLSTDKKKESTSSTNLALLKSSQPSTSINTKVSTTSTNVTSKTNVSSLNNKPTSSYLTKSTTPRVNLTNTTTSPSNKKASTTSSLKPSTSKSTTSSTKTSSNTSSSKSSSSNSKSNTTTSKTKK